MLPTNFIERRQSVKEITCDLIQVARAGASRTGDNGRCDPHGQVVGGVGVVGIMGVVGVMGEVGVMGGASRTGREQGWEVWE